MRTSLIGLFLLSTCCCAADLQSLYDKKQFFDLRDAVVSGETSPFVRAVVACSFNDEKACLSESKAFWNSSPSQDLAIEVYDNLFGFHVARGHWQEALAVMEAEVALRGEAEDHDNLREMCRAFLRHGPLIVDHVEHSSIRVLYKNAHVPVTVNGRGYRGYVDSGANISMISESAARRLGMQVESVNFKFSGAAGGAIRNTRIAVADRFTIGNIRLRNVPFIVVDDRQEPFVSWGSGKGLVVGLQVLIAARNMTWKSAFLGLGAKLELARPSAARSLKDSNFCLDALTPLAAAEFQGRRLTMFVDTGAGGTILRPAFGRNFPEALNAAERKMLYFQGVDGTAKVEAAILPLAPLRVAGRDAIFRRLPVYLKGSVDAYDGMFGNDLSRKVHELTLDFESMRLVIR